MAEKKYDPVRVPVINQTPGEIDEMYDAIDRGDLPKDYVDRHFRAVRENVFGDDHKSDRKGNPIEQGLGSSGNQTRNSIESYRKYGVNEPDYAENLKRMEAELAASNERRKSETDKKGSGKRRYAA